MGNVPTGEIFSQRLARVRGSRSKRAFCKAVGINSPQTYQHYENGRVPDADTLAMIADRCGVTVDWLLGRSDGGGPDDARYMLTGEPSEDVSATSSAVTRSSTSLGNRSISPPPDPFHAPSSNPQPALPRGVVKPDWVRSDEDGLAWENEARMQARLAALHERIDPMLHAMVYAPAAADALAQRVREELAAYESWCQANAPNARFLAQHQQTTGKPSAEAAPSDGADTADTEPTAKKSKRKG